MKTVSNDAHYNYKDGNEFFEYWSNLAKTDPERCEAERKAEIEKVISQANPDVQQSLRSIFLYVCMEQKR